MWKKRIETGFTLVAAAAGLLLVAILGLWVYMSATATPLHPNPQDVPSVSRAAPPPQWAGAVEQGRQLVRAALGGQNLPGVSVAVGVGGAPVWAEGFGWADLDERVPVTPETRFRIGMASTALTSAAVGLLLENGRLTLDDVTIERARRGFQQALVQRFVLREQREGVPVPDRLREERRLPRTDAE